MGYRLDIKIFSNNNISETIFYGTKYYGYNDLENSLSYRFLRLINKLEGDEIFDYGEDNTIFLNYSEFKIFCELYNIDLNNEKNNKQNMLKDVFINCDEIKTLLEDEDNIKYYVLSWG